MINSTRNQYHQQTRTARPHFKVVPDDEQLTATDNTIFPTLYCLSVQV